MGRSLLKGQDNRIPVFDRDPPSQWTMKFSEECLNLRSTARSHHRQDETH
jgi:hypothetical protein